MRNIDVVDCHIKFGECIKKARERKEMSQYEVAPMVGISQPYLSYIEQGKRDIDFVLALKLCEAVGVDIREFIEEHLL